MHGARNVGGGEYSIYYLITNLRKDLFSPLVFYAHENELTKRLRNDGITLIHIPFHERITSVYRDEIRTGPVALFNYFRHLMAAVYETVKALRKYRVDILHPHDNLSKIIGGAAAKIAGVKVVAHCRDLLTRSLTEKILIYYQLLFMDRIIAVSESNRNVFEIWHRIPKKVRKIYNGIDLKKFVPAATVSLRETMGIKDGDIIIGVIGVFDNCKGHIYLFQAIERLLSEGNENIVCLVAGDGRERPVLEGFVNEKNLGQHIIFLGYRNDVPELLDAIEILVVPSIQESFPRVALEAMAMRVPVIATEVGGLPESVDNGKTGIIVPPGDADALCRALDRLIKAPELRDAMGAAGRKRAETMFSLESNIRNTEKLYLDIAFTGIQS